MFKLLQITPMPFPMPMGGGGGGVIANKIMTLFVFFSVIVLVIQYVTLILNFCDKDIKANYSSKKAYLFCLIPFVFYFYKAIRFIKRIKHAKFEEL